MKNRNSSQPHSSKFGGRGHPHSYAQGLGVAYQTYARALIARAVNSNLSPEKTLSLAGIGTHDLRDTELVRYQLSYPAWVNFVLKQFSFENVLHKFHVLLQGK